jgi:hypothetical protein
MDRRLITAGIGFFLFAFQGNAQVHLSGVVLDKSKKPLTGVNVLLLRSQDSALQKGVITDETGAYSLLKIKPGTYLLSFSAAGFEKSYSPVISLEEGEERNIGTQVLSEASQQMADVTVTAKKPLFEQKIDRMVVNVEGNITTAGSNILDILERSPGVVVDRQNNSISLSGKNGVVVMINGKINRMPISAVLQMLAGMSAGNIEKIELITTPPAGLDAEGNAGYINIVLKVNDQFGTNGSYSLSIGYGNREMPQFSINFNHRQGKVNVYGDYSFSRLHREMDWPFYHRISNGGTIWESATFTARNTYQRNHNLRLGMDYQLSKRSVLGLLFTGYNNKWSMDALNLGYTSINGHKDTILQIKNVETNLWTNYGVNLNFQHSFSEGEKIAYNFDYLHYRDDNPVSYLSDYSDGNNQFVYQKQTRSGKITPISFWVNAFDYNRRLGKRVNLETGLKSTISKFQNDVGIDRLEGGSWISDPALSAKYELKEDIEAAYASINANPDGKTEIKAGLRYEYTNSNLGSDSLKNIVDRHYGNLFPSIFLSRKFGDNNNLSLAYSRRITRPTFNDMAPFTIFIDPTTFFSGNPALQPSLTDAIKMNYSYKKLILSLSYSYEKSPIANFNPTVDSITKIETLSSANLQNNKVVSAVLTLPLSPRPWWNIVLNVTGVWSETNAIYNLTPLRIDQENININMTQSFKLPGDYSMDLTGFYQSPTFLGIYALKAIGSLDVGVRKKLGKGNLRLAYTNILNTMTYRLYVDKPDLNLVLKADISFLWPAVHLTYTRNFGKDNLKANRDRSTGAEDEKGRVN